MCRRRIGGIMVLTALLLVGMECMSFAAERTKIVYLHDPSWDAAGEQWFIDAGKRFEEENPDIEVEYLIPANRGQQIDKIIAMYAGGILPDVICTFPTNGYRFAREGVFRDIGPFMAKESNLKWQDFFPTAVESCQIVTGEFAGGYWMMPFSIWTVGTCYNLDLFGEAGLQAPSEYKYQWTWDDLADLGRKLVRRGGDGRMQRAGALLATSWDRWSIFVHNAGGSFYDRPVEPTASRLNSEPVRLALSFFQVALQSYASGAWTADNIANIPIVIGTGPSHTLNHSTEGRTYDYAFGPPPKLVRGGSENHVLGMAMSSQSQHPEEAWRFMKFMATDAAASHIAATGRPVPWGPAAKRYQQLFPGGSEWEYIWIDIIAHPETFCRPVVPPEIPGRLNPIMQQAIAGRLAPSVAAEMMHEQAEAILRASRNGN